MPEPVQDVEQVDSSTTPAVEEVEETTGQEAAPDEESQQTQDEDPSAPEDVNEPGDVDEKGVPYKNRAAEAQRKLIEAENRLRQLEGNLPNIVQDAVAKAIPPQGQAKPTYTKEQLIEFKNSTDDPRNKTWAEVELEKLRGQETQKLFETQITEDRNRRQLDQDKQNALSTVFKKYPLMFNADGSWNNNHPLTQKLSKVYNSRDVFKNDAYGLLGAADIAFSEFVLESQPQLARTTKKLKRQVKKLQKTTLIEGSGQAQTQSAKTTMQSAAERLAQSGSEEDLQAYTKEMLRGMGKIR